jgi:hypothetical protein
MFRWLKLPLKKSQNHLSKRQKNDQKFKNKNFLSRLFSHFFLSVQHHHHRIIIMEALEVAVLRRKGGGDEEDKTIKLWREPLRRIADLENQEKRDALATSLVPLAKFFFSEDDENENANTTVTTTATATTTIQTTTFEEPPKLNEYDFVTRDVSFSTPRGKFDVYKMKNSSSILLYSCNPKKKESLLLRKENMATFAVLPTEDSNGTQFLVVSLKEEVTLPSVKNGIKAIVWQSRAQLSAAEKKLKVTMGEGGEGAMSEEEVKDAFTVGEHNLSEEDTLKNSVGLMRCYVKSCGVKEYTKGFVKVKCVLKFNDGYLFLLRKRLIFLERPAIVTLVEDLDELRIMRAEAGGSSNFDLACKLDGVEYEFLNISKEYLLPVREWLSVVCEEAPVEGDDGDDEEDGGMKKRSSKKEDTPQDILQDINSDSDDDDDSDDDFKGEESEEGEDDDDANSGSDDDSDVSDDDDDSDDDDGAFNTVAKNETKEKKKSDTGTKRPREEKEKEEKKGDDDFEDDESSDSDNAFGMRSVAP